MKRFFVFGFVVILLCGLIIKTEAVTQGVNEALVLCAQAVVPALFPFFVISGIMVNTGMVSLMGKYVSPVARCVMGISGKGAVAFLIGLLCGYPTGAKVIADMYKSGAIKKREAESLLAFCNNSGPLFVIGAVGTEMLGNHKTGIILYAIHAVSAFLCAVVFGLFAKRKKDDAKEEIMTVNLGEAIAKSVEQAVISILNVCGYVVFFACVTTLLRPYIRDCFLLSLIEVTAGTKELAISNLPNTFVLISGAVGFGGVCVLFQVMSVASAVGLSVRKYIAGKIFQAMVAMLITRVCESFWDTVPVFTAVTNKTFYEVYAVMLLFLACSIFTFRRLTKKD